MPTVQDGLENVVLLVSAIAADGIASAMMAAPAKVMSFRIRQAPGLLVLWLGFFRRG